jgi:methionyl-tRNA formyltransferase
LPFRTIFRLATELAAFGADCIVKTLAELPARKETALVQDESSACKAPKLTLKDGFLSLDESASELFHVRAATTQTCHVVHHRTAH